MPATTFCDQHIYLHIRRYIANHFPPHSHLQVLANPDLREKYDSHGIEGLDVNFMDGAEFFNMLFGSDSFEHLVGELIIATVAR